MKLGIYITIGDFGATYEIIAGVIRGGVKFLELGIPFSDPLLDGTVIQQSHIRSILNYKTSWVDIEQLILKVRTNFPDIMLGIMCSYQSLYVESRFKICSLVDALLFTDLSPFVTLQNINTIHAKYTAGKRVLFVSQDLVLQKEFQIPNETISMVYLTRVQGITGQQQAGQTTTTRAIQRLKQMTKAPIYLGFGISNKHDLDLCRSQGADGAIIGSAFVAAIKSHLELELQTGQTIAQFAQSWVENVFPK